MFSIKLPVHHKELSVFLPKLPVFHKKFTSGRSNFKNQNLLVHWSIWKISFYFENEQKLLVSFHFQILLPTTYQNFFLEHINQPTRAIRKKLKYLLHYQ